MTNQVIESIKTRRSVGKVDQDRVPPKEIIEQILDAATWAPNHFLTEPWRFVVFAGNERLALGDAMSSALSKTLDATDQEREKKLDAEKKKPLRAPIVIALVSSPRVGDLVISQEEIVAAGAALQNMLLTAHSLSLGAMVRTGKTSYSEEVRNLLKMKGSESLVGLVYLGYPVEKPHPGKRSGYSGKVEWRGI